MPGPAAFARAQPTLCFLNELLLAFRAGNGDLALTFGNPDALAASGTGVIPMVPVLEPSPTGQKPPVFPVTLVGVAGQGTENRKAH